MSEEEGGSYIAGWGSSLYDTPTHSRASNLGSIESGQGGTGVLPTPPAPNLLNLISPDKEAAPMVTIDSDPGRADRLKAICLEYLALCREDTERVARARIHYVALARLYGLTHQQIGDALGVTEAAIRAMLARAA